MAPWLEELATRAEDLSSFPSMPGSSQPPVTSTLGNLTPFSEYTSTCRDTDTHVHKCTCMHIHIN